MAFGLILGILASIWIGRAARDHELAAALPSPWLTACLGLGILILGWVLANAAPRFATALAGAALPGALYGAISLAADGDRLLAYGWSAVPVALMALAIRAGSYTSGHGPRSWSSRRARAPRVPRLRVR